MRTKFQTFTWTLAVLLAPWILAQLCQPALAQTESWEAGLTLMKHGAVRMIEGGKMMQDKTDAGSAEKTIKEGHRMMMEAERTVAKIQKDMMRQGAKMMMDGLELLKAKNDVVAAEKLMTQGHKMILEAEKMMSDARPEKMMQGSRTMMRGLRMRQERDLNAADKLMAEGRRMMTEAEQAGTSKK
jgi:hypothetical protein